MKTNKLLIAFIVLQWLLVILLLIKVSPVGGNYLQSTQEYLPIIQNNLCIPYPTVTPTPACMVLPTETPTKTVTVVVPPPPP